MRIAWYLGVDIGDGLCDCDAVVSRKSRVAFEWRLQRSAGDVEQYVITSPADNVVSRGVSAPDFVSKTQIPLDDLERYATEAAADAKGCLQERLGCNEFAVVACKYVGIVGASGEVDINGKRLQRSTAAFEWTIQAPECEWKEVVRAVVMDCSARLIPLPSCTVTHGRLQGAARAATQVSSDLSGFEIRCVYPAVPSLCWNTFLILISNRWGAPQVRHGQHHCPIN